MRTLLFSLAMLVLAAPVLAQPSVSVKAGLNVADMFYDSDDFSFDPDPRLGFVGGVSVDAPLSSALGVRVEALYAQKGYANDVEIVDVIGGPELNGTVSIKLDYLEVPVLLNVTAPMQSGLEIGLQAGVAPAFLLRDGIGCSGFENDEVEVCAETEDDDLSFRSFDLGAALGATIGAGPFAVDLRYTHGLSNLADEDVRDDLSIRNRVFSVTGVYRFGR